MSAPFKQASFFPRSDLDKIKSDNMVVLVKGMVEDVEVMKCEFIS
jgi:hypothetical protein